MIKIKKQCSYRYCHVRRKHWQEPDTTRGHQYVDVPEDYIREDAYCSITCMMIEEGIRTRNRNAQLGDGLSAIKQKFEGKYQCSN